MRTSKGFTIKFVRLNNHRVKAVIPTKTISLEEGLKIHKRLLRQR